MNKVHNIYTPVLRSPKTRPAGIAAAPRQRAHILDFFVCFFSFSMLLLSNMWGLPAILGFLAPWLLIVLRNFQEAQRAISKNWPLFLLPALTILSTAWSDAPQTSLKGGFEFAATVAIGILAGWCIKPRVFLTSLLSTFILIAICCLAVGRQEIISTTGEYAYTGIFGSKNAFSGAMSLLMLVAVAVYLDKGQSRFFRLAALTGILLTPVLIYFGHSLGAILAACFAVAIFLAVCFLTRFQPKARLAIGIFIFLIALSATVIGSIANFDSDSILHFMGKSSSLTGRTYLWENGLNIASERPLLGYGIFWRVDNPTARKLWYESHVPPGPGFGFHSEYIEMLVSLGLVGLIIMLSQLFVLGRRVVKRVLNTMTQEQNFAFIIFTYFMIRSPVEAEIFSQFNICMILFCVAWVYFQPAKTIPVPHGALRK